MKKSIVEYVAKYVVCQQLKIVHQRPGGLLQPLNFPVWKWGSISMDLLLVYRVLMMVTTRSG